MGAELWVASLLAVLQGAVLLALGAAWRAFRSRLLDPSEIKTLREWSGRLHEIGELRETIAELNATLRKEGLDRMEVQRVRRFFFGSDTVPPELHNLKGRLQEHELRLDRTEERVESIETERRESNRRLDGRLDRMDKRLDEIGEQIGDTLQTLTSLVERWPAPGGGES